MTSTCTNPEIGRLQTVYVVIIEGYTVYKSFHRIELSWCAVLTSYSSVTTTQAASLRGNKDPMSHVNHTTCPIGHWLVLLGFF